MLGGQYIPVSSNRKIDTVIVLVGEKPSDFYVKHPELRNLGNYNNLEKSLSDRRLNEYVNKYLVKVYATDMVKIEGPSGADFETEWKENPVHRNILREELEKIKPKAIGALGRNVERLLKQEFPQYTVVYITHPSAVRYPKNLARWQEQFAGLALKAQHEDMLK